METVYREKSGGRWNYWTYAEGLRVMLSAAQYEKMMNQGARSVRVH